MYVIKKHIIYIMPLIQLWEKSPDIVLQYNIKQIVSAAGDGVLADNTECSRELKYYLSNIPVEKLSEHIDYCLRNSFEKSGFVLQDIINELGRRLDYEVEGGLFQGRSNQIGYDGIWQSPDGHALIIEIKTTDAYRINLDTIAGYRSKLIANDKVSMDKSSILIVVGRNDTGDLEAQIRGSRHAWDTRVISADALVKLVELNVKSDEEETTDKIRSLLIPFEYTRLDNIIDVIFTAAKDVESASDAEEIADEVDNNSAKTSQKHTPREILDNIRNKTLEALSKRENTTLIAHKRAQFGSSDKKVRVVCVVSKQYNGGDYWYAYHPRYNTFLSDAEKGYYVLGCIGKNFSYAIPYMEMQQLLPFLNTTPKADKTYWHISLYPNNTGGYDLVLKGRERLNLEQYKVFLSDDHFSITTEQPNKTMRHI